MTLLIGLNYDISGQQRSLISTQAAAAATTLIVQNTEGYADDDYIVIAPGTEKSEIVRINAAVASDTSLTITALKFAHYVNEEVYRIPYNQMKFYQCASETGTYVLIASSTTDMQYDTQNTVLDTAEATADYYYKRTFYNETTTTESDIALSQAWQTDDEPLYITEEELRIFLQFDENDYPTRSDMRFFITTAMKFIGVDIDSTSENVLFIATLLRAKALVMRGLASKAVSKGYIQVNAEGRTITKSYQEMVLEAENVLQEYKEFILAVDRREVTSTNFFSNTEEIDSLTRTDIIAIMNGVNDVTDFQNQFRYNNSRRR